MLFSFYSYNTLDLCQCLVRKHEWLGGEDDEDELKMNEVTS